MALIQLGLDQLSHPIVTQARTAHNVAVVQAGSCPLTIPCVRCDVWQLKPQTVEGWLVADPTVAKAVLFSLDPTPSQALSVRPTALVCCCLLSHFGAV